MRTPFYSAVLIATLAVGCGIGRSIEATYCVAINTHGTTEDENLSKRLSRFGAKMGLKAHLGDEVIQRYESKDGLFDIGVSFGMGDFGTIVTFFPSTPGAGQNVLKNLQLMIETEIAAEFKVTPCGDIKGFKTPTLYKRLQ